MNKKTIPSDVLDSLVDRAIYKEATEENLEFGHALKKISGKELDEILNSGKRKRRFNRLLWERIEWSIAVAALIAVAITVPISVENHFKDKICNIVYAYNSPQLSALASSNFRSAGEELPDITKMNDDKLKNTLPQLEERFEKSESMQDIAINGEILTFAYIRLHMRKEACNILETMIERLSGDEDYLKTIEECKNILDQIK